MQILHDEINTLQLELTQIEERNLTLQKDNAKLLERWLDAKQAEANKLNQANEYYEDMRTRRHASSGENSQIRRDESQKTLTIVSDDASTVSGKGVEREGETKGKTRDGTESLSDQETNSSPNG